MATLICLPLNHVFANGIPIRPFTKEMWEYHPYYGASYQWHIIAKGNRIDGIEGMY